MAETTVGSIVGFMRLDTSDFIEKLEKAIAMTDRLDGKKVDVKVDADTASAQAQLALLKERLEAVDDSNAKVSASSRESGKGIGAMVAAAVTLGPALVPLAAGATAVGVAFGGMAASGLVAIKGVKDQMEQATPVGRAFTAGVQTLSADLDKLGATAAPRVLGSFQDAVRLLNGSMPQLNALTGDLATVTAKVAVNVLSGMLTGLQQMTPLIQTGAVEVLQLSRAFNSLMSGSGVTEFGMYARSVLPQVVTTVEDLATTAGHLVVALEPLGGGALTAIQAISQAINAIPMPVLTALATAAPAAFLGFKSAGLFKDGVLGLSSALEGMGAAGERAAVGMRSLEAAAGPIGLAVAAASLALSFFSEQSRQGQQAVDNLTDAFKASHGAISQQIVDLQYTALQQSGAIDAAKRLGFSLADVTQASLGNAAALARLRDESAQAAVKADALAKASEDSTVKMSGTRLQAVNMKADISTLNGALGDANQKLVEGRQNYQDYNAATSTAAGATVQATAEQTRLAGALGITVPALIAAQQAQQGQASSTAAATLQMQLQNDAAGLLRAALDQLNGKVLNVEEAQTRNAQAVQNATKTIRDNKNALDLSTAAGVANRAAIEQAAQAAQAQALAVAQQTGSQQKANGTILASRDALLAQLRAQGSLTPAIQDYITKLYAVPKTVKTSVEASTGQASAAVSSFISNLQRVNGMTATAYVNTVVQGSARKLAADVVSGVNTRAEGGLTLANGVRAMASGGVLGRQAMVASSPILWAEAGPEAYIPLSPSKRARSVPLLAATNAAMGDPLGASRSSGPAVFHLYDSNGALLGTMRGIADGSAHDAIKQAAREIGYGNY